MTLPASAPTTLTLDDAALAGRIRAGDQTAMADLYDMRGGQAFGLAYNILGDRVLAEDAVQEAFLSVWNHSARLDERRGRVSSLLMTVVHHRAVDLLRKQRGQRSLCDGIESLERDSGATPVADLVTDEMSRVAVRRAVDTLPEAQRRTVMLAYFEGCTHREIATTMGVPAGTVKSRLRLALERMRLTLNQSSDRNWSSDPAR